MHFLAINPPHPSIGSRIPREHLPPLGLLSIGGSLRDAGHRVELLDAEFGPMAPRDVAARTAALDPDAVLIGHAGSTSAHPIITKIAAAIREVSPGTLIVYGGPFPTYHWSEILTACPQIDIVVRGEGEETVRRLAQALESAAPLHEIAGLAFRQAGEPIATPPAPVIADLDCYRVGWELADLSRYSYWGGQRAAIVQFSRGCPHRCTYCGQRGFWTQWRHRDPKLFAAEIAWLHREHGVRVFNLADENPTTSRRLWRDVLEALIAQRLDISIFGTMRADDIVRDADMLHLYRQAGIRRILLGMDQTDESTLRQIRKGGSTEKDREAVGLLRRHDIVSMVSFIAGFGNETDRYYWRGMRQLVTYDCDLVQTFYATPHGWTPYARSAADRRIIQTDLAKWDYKHQVLQTTRIPAWRVFAWLKAIEIVNQLRPRALLHRFARKDRRTRQIMRWYYRIGRAVFLHEVWSFLFVDRRTRNGPMLARFWALPGDEAESAMARLAALPARRIKADWPSAANTHRTEPAHEPAQKPAQEKIARGTA
jgi:anaerobic magnesium-protoporphyrin IX monomethyl ester cyclase